MPVLDRPGGGGGVPGLLGLSEAWRSVRVCEVWGMFAVMFGVELGQSGSGGGVWFRAWSGSL